MRILWCPVHNSKIIDVAEDDLATNASGVLSVKDKSDMVYLCEVSNFKSRDDECVIVKARIRCRSQ